MASSTIRTNPARPSGFNDARLGRIKLRHLNCFLEIVRSGSARATAETLCITESAVSKTIRDLEHCLGLRLFDRSRHGMSPTEAGLRFARYARNAVDALRLGVGSATDPLGGGITLRIGASPGIAELLLPEIVQALTRDMADLTVQVLSGSSAELMGHVRDGGIEFALGRLPPAPMLRGLSFEQLLVDRLVFVVRPGHPLAAFPDMRFWDIARFPVALPPPDSMTWQEVQRIFVAHDVVLPSMRLETYYAHLQRAYVLGSDAVWAVSAWFAKADIQAGTLVKLPLESAMLESPLGIVTKPGSDRTVHAREMLTRIRERCAAIGQGTDDA